MIISLYLPNMIMKYRLPSDIFGSYSFEDNEGNRIINVESREGKWVLYSTRESHVMNNNLIIDSVEIKPNTYYLIKFDDKTYIVYFSLPENNSYKCYEYTNLDISIGYNASISIPLNFLKDNVIIRKENEHIMLNKPSSLFIYVNNQSVTSPKTILNYGDIVEVYGLKVMILEKLLFVSSYQNITINNMSSGLTSYNYPEPVELMDESVKENLLYKKDDYFSKSAMILRTIEDKEMQLSTPPSITEMQDAPLILTIAPMLTMAITSIITIGSTISNIITKKVSLKASLFSLLLSGTLIIFTFIWPIIMRKYNKKMQLKNKKNIINKYTAYLTDRTNELESEVQQERDIINENLVDAEGCINIINRKKVMFWSKRPDNEDFLKLRVGIGTQPLKLNIKYPESGFTIDENELKNKADEISVKYRYIEDVPISYSFLERNITAVMGNMNDSYEFVNNLILQLITFYSYEDVKIVLFTNKDNEKKWEYVKYLPHCFDNEKNWRFFSTCGDDISNVLEFLVSEFSHRVSCAQQGINASHPHYFIVIDSYEQVKKLESMKYLTESSAGFGFSFIIIESRLSNLPSKCNNFIMLNGSDSVILKSTYQSQIRFKSDITAGIDMMSIAKTLSNIPIEFENESRMLPNSISFLEMEDVGKVEQLNILNRWNSNDPISSLKAEVGVTETGDILYLDLHEKAHGPHGLVAGTTGSGKSEFLITYILSMCMNYGPDIVSFILIDYKGGGLAGAFDNKINGIELPHLAGTITNLDKSEMDRTLVSINSEIKRRQKMFNDARDRLCESTIDIYKYQKFYLSGKVSEPISHLFIICDEFAELKAQQPDFMDNLISVARIGRSLGIHLILATQKPSGVVDDQIWSNTRFRACFKVQNEADSREMLKRGEAASIKQTGRFYLQVGYDEQFILGQSAWSGAKYFPSDQIIKQEDKSINFINNYGRYIKSIQDNNTNMIAPVGDQITSIIKYIIEVSNKINRKAQRLWLPNIPSVLLPDQIFDDEELTKNLYRICVGVYDAPEIQEQGLVKYDFIKDGNTLIYGNEPSEMENLVNVIICESCKKISSDLINYYIVDYGSETFKQYKQMPQVGDVILNYEEDKINSLYKFIKSETSSRRKLLSAQNLDFKSYNEKNSNKLPLEVIVLNNYSSISDENTWVYEKLPDLLRDSERLGIVYIIVGSTPTSISSKITQYCENVYTFKQKDSTDYGTIFGTRTKIVPRDSFGRGLINILDGIHEFQTLSLAKDLGDVPIYIKTLINEQKNLGINPAKSVPKLPEQVSYDLIQEIKYGIKNVPIGISKNNLQMVTYNFNSNISNVILANKLDDTKNYTISLLSLLNSIDGQNLIVFDPNNDLRLSNKVLNNYFIADFNNRINNLINYIKTSSNESKGIIMIYNFTKFIKNIDMGKFSELVNLIKSTEKFSFIVCDSANKLKLSQFEPWYQDLVSSVDGVWIGNGISDQGVIHVGTITKEMLSEVKKDMGFVTTDGNTQLCKLINFKKSDNYE